MYLIDILVNDTWLLKERWHDSTSFVKLVSNTRIPDMQRLDNPL